ncbi:MAG TPA: MmcQ/YjbR family DNA-binding protein [Gemmataceae bacterium]|nr:MmcQ/YjbR family DNA-binding protein [Gemmataceae bacterium]
MTADEFRNLALSLPEASEAAHMGHPDFRLRGKIFATLWPDDEWGMVKLTPEQQGVFIRSEPDVFQPVKGAWGRRGSTRVRLRTATEATVRQALVAAWRNLAPQRLSEQFEDE